MKLTNLHDLLVEEIQDMYDAEHQITLAMPQIIDMVKSQDLQRAFEKHLSETTVQIDKLNVIAKDLGIDPQGKACLGMEGIIEEAVELMQENDPSPVLDAALIAAAQKVEHYEIASYGSAATYAKELGLTDTLQLLLEILDEEKATDQKLTELAKTQENVEAINMSGMKAM